jgi:integrase
LKKELEDSLKVEPRSWLFMKRETKKAAPEPMSGTEFSNWANRILTRVFGKRTTLTALRHSFVSSEQDYSGSLRSISKVARSMGHSVGMSLGYVWRPSKDEEGSI